MNPRLTKNQQRTICSQLGRVKLQLLYKATIHGFTGAAFHQRCDNRSPTVSVGYNASGYVFGGYTKQPFSQSGQYVQDDQAFLGREDVRNVYNSGYIKEMMQEVGVRLGVPLSCVVPVKNYSEELELDPNCDILLLSAVNQMLRFADNYFDEISDRFCKTEIKE